MTLQRGLWSGLWRTGFTAGVSYVCLINSIRAAIPAHLIFLDLIIINVSWISSSCSFLHLSVIYSSFGPNIPLNTVFFHRQKTKGKILFVSVFKIYGFRHQARALLHAATKRPPSQNLTTFSFWKRILLHWLGWAVGWLVNWSISQSIMQLGASYWLVSWLVS